MDKCYDCKNFFNTEREALDRGYCMEHENFVNYDHEKCSWFIPKNQSSNKPQDNKGE